MNITNYQYRNYVSIKVEDNLFNNIFFETTTRKNVIETKNTRQYDLKIDTKVSLIISMVFIRISDR